MSTTDATDGPLRTRTVAVAAGRPGEPGAPFNQPPTFASTFRDGGAVGYGRWGNPTWSAFEEVLGTLEGGRALSFASGQAAMAALWEGLPVGATVVVPHDAYLGTRQFLDEASQRGRLRPMPVDVTDTDAAITALATADLMWLESPTNPMLGVADLPALLAAAEHRGVPSVVDNTLATPVLQQPLRLGATAVVHSATKYIGGHSDLLLGVVVTRDDELYTQLHTRRTLHGGTPGTMEAWLALRGLRTLPLRVDCAGRGAQTIAERLAADDRIRRVRYPGLPDDPGHVRAREQMSGFGAMLSFELDTAEQADRVVENLRLIVGGTSLGGVETTIDRRHRWPGEENVPPGLLRLSVGIEDPVDLLADLDNALTIAVAVPR